LEDKTMAGELVPYKQGPMGAIIEQVGMLFSYDRGDKAQAVGLYRAMQAADFGLDDLIGETIEVEHVVCHRAAMIDRETGETRDTIRTVLIAPDGTRYATRSETVRADLERACMIFGTPFPWRPAIRFKVVQVKSRDGVRRYLQLAPEIALPSEGK
jgi:hypothetical protein